MADSEEHVFGWDEGAKNLPSKTKTVSFPLNNFRVPLNNEEGFVRWEKLVAWRAQKVLPHRCLLMG